MIDPRRSTARRVGIITTGLVSLGAAAAIGWAAATPIITQTGGTAQPGTGGAATTSQVAQARANLSHVRQDVARILAGEDDLPRAALANLPSVQVPTVQLPTASVPAAVQAAPPVTHTTTGASGVVRP